MGTCWHWLRSSRIAFRVITLGRMAEQLSHVLNVRRTLILTEDDLPPEARPEVLQSAEPLYDAE